MVTIEYRPPQPAPPVIPNDLVRRFRASRIFTVSDACRNQTRGTTNDRSQTERWGWRSEPERPRRRQLGPHPTGHTHKAGPSEGRPACADQAQLRNQWVSGARETGSATSCSACDGQAGSATPRSSCADQTGPAATCSDRANQTGPATPRSDRANQTGPATTRSDTADQIRRASQPHS